MVKGFTVKALNEKARGIVEKFNIKDKRAFIEMTDEVTLKVLFYTRYSFFIRADAIGFFICKTFQENGLIRDIDYELLIW